MHTDKPRHKIQAKRIAPVKGQLRIVFLAELAAVAALVVACGPPDGTSPDVGAAISKAAPITNSEDAASNGQTLEQMLDRTMNRFAKLDLNGDGKLSPDELNAATEGGDLSDTGVTRVRHGFSARAFTKADANGDGVVTREEADTQARVQFKALDTNGDGRVSRDEATVAPRSITEPVPERSGSRLTER